MCIFYDQCKDNDVNDALSKYSMGRTTQVEEGSKNYQKM